jgi:phenylalanyl-tRNA synthetase alpha chain
MMVKELLESLSPIERKVLPYLGEHVKKIAEKSGLDMTSVLRALSFLKNKKIIDTKEETEKTIHLDVNGILYRKKGLPERRLLNLVAEKKNIKLEDAEKQSSLNKNEFKAALGALKKKALINVVNGTIMLQAKPDEITKKSLEEQFLEQLPMNLSELAPEQKFAYDNLLKRKNIVMLQENKKITVSITELGREVKDNLGNIDDSRFIEKLTPEIIKTSGWRGKKFRRYDIKGYVPKISGGKRHFVNQAVDYARKIWTELGFQEMPGNMIMGGFWNFDALFTAQDHPVREEHDTFYLKDVKITLPEKKLVEAVKKAHESGVDRSRGWGYKWDYSESEKSMLRTHTTCLSAQTLAKLRGLKDKKGKFFAIGKVFRNETVDWSHGFEFNQSEGIVVDKEANFRHLLGYLKKFYEKMGFDNVIFRPGFFSYTEPSVETLWWHPEKKVWLELGGAGIFRPELTVPLLGEHIPVLAWGQGFDRIITDYYNIKDLREMYQNDLTKLREMKIWR